MTEISTPVHGGKDPDELNAMRVEWGKTLCRTTKAMTATDSEDVICDSICNLLHACPAMGQDPAAELEQAVRHFNAETGEG